MALLASRPAAPAQVSAPVGALQKLETSSWLISAADGIYAQPPIPGPGYLWTPWYWAYDADGGYYPGAWVLAPQPGFPWTPGYWAWRDTGFFFHAGFWGPTIGFYGGINYGFGYFRHGFVGGRWQDGQFFYNRAVYNVNVTNIHNVYNTKVTTNTESHVSYNG